MRSIVLALLFVTVNVFGQAEESKAIPIKVYSANGIDVKSFDFKNLQEFLNKKDETTYVINFWATWCLPCVKELPHFETLNKNYKDKGVKVILVSLDMPKKVETNLIPFMVKKKLQSEVIHLDDPDANSWIELVDKKWSGSIPATIIYNKTSRQFYERSFTYEELEKELKTILK